MTDREETPFLRRELCPEENAGSFSRCTLGFIWKYLKLGENFDKVSKISSVVSLWLSAMLIEWFSDPDPKWAYFHSALDPLCLMSLMLISLVVTSYLYFWFEYQCYILGKSCYFWPHFRKLSA